MRISELKQIIDSVNDEDDNLEVVIFIATDFADNGIIVSLDNVNITDCRAELIPSTKLKLYER